MRKGTKERLTAYQPNLAFQPKFTETTWNIWNTPK